MTHDKEEMLSGLCKRRLLNITPFTESTILLTSIFCTFCGSRCIASMYLMVNVSKSMMNVEDIPE